MLLSSIGKVDVAQSAISVIIPTYNNGPVLAEALRALQRQTLDQDEMDLVIVDDGSTDGTASIAAEFSGQLKHRYIWHQNLGAAAARNHGASVAKSELLLFLDSDVVSDRTLVHEHIQCHGQHDRALIIGPTRSVPAGSGGLFFDVMGESLFSCDLGDLPRSVTFQQVLSRNLSLHRTAFLEIGGFDEGFPRSGFEDIDFAYRAALLQYQLVYSPGASGVHHHTGSFAQVERHMYDYQTSAVLLMKKHPELKGQIRHLVDKEPVNWGQDGPRLIARKLLRRVLALAPSHWLLQRTTTALERWYPSPSLLRFMYWKLLGTSLLRGFRHGMALYGSPFTASSGSRV